MNLMPLRYRLNNILCLLVLAMTPFPSSVMASDQKLVSGAGTLKGGETALTLDLGFDYPEPLFYGVRLDFGIGDRFQFGTGLSTFIFVNTLSLNSTFNLLKTKNESDFLSLYLNGIIHYVNFGFLIPDIGSGSPNTFMFFLQPGLAYERRIGEKRNIGIYFKFGTIHPLVNTNEKAGLWDQTAVRRDVVVLAFRPGMQFHLAEDFSLTLEGAFYMAPQENQSIRGGTTRVRTGGGRIGFSFFF